MTATEALLGTPHYMAPEQISSDSADLTSAADIYGLGAILYELITGAPPFHGESTLVLLRKVGEDEPPRPSSKNRHIPIDLETIALRCLRKEPTNRYSSAHELATDLIRFTNGEPIAARRVNTLERISIWARRRPLAAGLVATVLVLLVILGVQLRFQRMAPAYSPKIEAAHSFASMPRTKASCGERNYQGST